MYYTGSSTDEGSLPEFVRMHDNMAGMVNRQDEVTCTTVVSSGNVLRRQWIVSTAEGRVIAGSVGGRLLQTRCDH